MLRKIREYLPFNALLQLGLVLVVTGLFFSKVFISVGSMILFGVWLLDVNLGNRILQFFSNKAAVLLFAVFLLHAIGLLYSENLDFGSKDVRIKLPLGFMPLIFSSGISMTKKQLDKLQYLYLGSLVLLTLLCMGNWILHHEEISDKRDMSLFISHIRFGLFASLGFFMAVHYFVKQKTIWFLIIALWILGYMVFAQLMTGLFITATVAPFVFIYLLHDLGVNRLRNILASLFAIIMLGSTIYALIAYRDFNKAQIPKSLPQKTHSAKGSVYFPKPNEIQPKLRENGYLIYHQIAYNELKETWNEKSELNYDGQALNGTPLNIILLRYLTSKGVPKDREGISQLSPADMQAIERGIPNVRYVNRSGIYVRLQEILWEIHNYINGGNYNGHSVVMRLEYLITGVQVWQRNLLFGVGNGDLQDAFDEQYEINQSVLDPIWRLRTHNQYISIAASLGIIGLSVFLISLFYPLSRKNLSFEYYVFLSIALLSMLTDDTLETQAGVTFFAFFNSLYLFGIRKS